MRSMLWLALLLAGCAATGNGPAADANRAIAADAPGSEVWLGRLQRGSNWAIKGLKNISTRQGYDNQPGFVANSSGVYYTSIRDGEQADIYLYEPAVGGRHRHTATPQSEFSAQAMPLGQGFSVVRVEQDGSQGLWSYAGGRPFNLLANVTNVGYYTWLDPQTVAVFQVTEPPQLAIATVPNGSLETVRAVPGRSLHRLPGTGDLTFVDKTDADAWWISRYERTSRRISRIAPALPDSEDFAWTPDGQLLMASGRKIFVWRDEWQLVADLGDTVAGKITRITVAPDGRQIALAAAEGGGG